MVLYAQPGHVRVVLCNTIYVAPESVLVRGENTSAQTHHTSFPLFEILKYLSILLIFYYQAFIHTVIKNSSMDVEERTWYTCIDAANDKLSHFYTYFLYITKI